MAMICDVCETKFDRDAGQSTLHVSPPQLDFKTIDALVAAGQAIEHRDRLNLDLCLGCTAKVLTHLGLSAEICAPIKMPMPPAPANPADSPNAGELSEEDLRALGLLDPGARDDT